jgi:hypothetical protein
MWRKKLSAPKQWRKNYRSTQLLTDLSFRRTYTFQEVHHGVRKLYSTYPLNSHNCPQHPFKLPTLPNQSNLCYRELHHSLFSGSTPPAGGTTIRLFRAMIKVLLISYADLSPVCAVDWSWYKHHLIRHTGRNPPFKYFKYHALLKL